ncbi:oligosaccharide flippase family protein, partial [Vibrio breoganii]
ILNSIWMLFERVVTVIGALTITIYTARYLGPDQFGMITYALAIASIIIPISQLGSQTLLFDRIIKNKDSGITLLIISSKIRKYVFCIVSVFVMGVSYLSGSDELQILIIFLIILSSYFTAQDAYKAYYDATLQSKINSITSQIGLILALVSRYLMVEVELTVGFFCLPYIINTMAPYVIKKIHFRNQVSIRRVNSKTRRKYRDFSLKAGLPLAISSLSVVLYTKLGQVILAHTNSVQDVGLFNAGATVSQGWMFVPLILMTVLLTKAIDESSMIRKNTAFSFIFLVCAIVSSSFVLLLIMYPVEAILHTFGEEFLGASKLVVYLSVGTWFSVVGTISSRIIINSGGYSFLMKKTVLVALVNVIFSIILIYRLGVEGAAIALMLTEILSATVFNYFYRKKSIFWIHYNMFKSAGYFKNIING